MNIVREKEIIAPEITEKLLNYSEIFDVSRFSIPAEIHIADEKIGW